MTEIIEIAKNMTRRILILGKMDKRNKPLNEYQRKQKEEIIDSKS